MSLDPAAQAHALGLCLAAGVLLAGLAACQVRPVPGSGEGEPAGAPAAAETPAAAGPAEK